jgi:phosphohistidine swiveling domain-containing protein
MSLLSFSSKSENLANLENRLSTAKVLPQIALTFAQWQKMQCSIVSYTSLPSWTYERVIVRSSAKNEDASEQSLAGKYLSVANVHGLKNINNAIDSVFSSYGTPINSDSVFVQPMLCKAAMSGVAFSRDPNTGGHYYIINYDDTSGKLDTVTDGSSCELKTYYQAKKVSIDTDSRLQSIINLLDELEQVFQHSSLDVEFAISEDDTLYLLQVRPLLINANNTIPNEQQNKILDNIEIAVKRLSKRHPYLLGESGVFGVMPDWNPRPLAFSLYKELITDNIWAYQRHNYGYRNLRSFPLLISLNGLPYVDVRVSFNSFIPADLDEKLAERLVEIYLQKLRDNPNYHDKVEFEIIHSCFTPDLSDQLNYLKEYNFSSSDIESLIGSLKNLTDKVIYSKEALWIKDLEKIEKLTHRQSTILDSDLSHIEKIYWLIEDCKRYGTLPFAGLARAGFIAIQILKSFVRLNLINAEEYDALLSSKETISSEMTKDYQRLSNQDFLGKYGHLRPGAYDILTSRYDEAPEQYFKDTKVTQAPEATDNQKIQEIETRLKYLLSKIDYTSNPEELFSFLWGAIKGREYSKFIFTKSLSNILSLLDSWGQSQGVNKEEMSFADIQLIKQCYACSESNLPLLKDNIKSGKLGYLKTCSVQLPALITSHKQIKRFLRPKTEPNFITLGKTCGQVLHIGHNTENFEGCILMIPNADPGFDWIFLHKISGFITMYGGVNSHMAIRAGELAIPAVIGAGESLYSQWAKAEYLDIDCANKIVREIR